MSDAFCEEGFGCVGGVGAGEEVVGDVLSGGWWCCWGCHGGGFMNFPFEYLVKKVLFSLFCWVMLVWMTW